LQTIADDLENELTGYQIEILGVNWNRDLTTNNDLMTLQRDLPFLQDTSDVDVQSSWSPNYRDVVILDAQNEIVAYFNLTTNDLGSTENAFALKALLLETAEFDDSDLDGIGDDWEEIVLGADGSTDGDADGDQASDFAEYVHGSDGGDSGSRPVITPAIQTVIEGDRYLTVTFRRRLGTAGGLMYTVEQSDAQGNWTSYNVSTVERMRSNPYDGTGTIDVTCRLPMIVPDDAKSESLVRVRVNRP
jgi:hypothetical protein